MAASDPDKITAKSIPFQLSNTEIDYFKLEEDYFKPDFIVKKQISSLGEGQYFSLDGNFKHKEKETVVFNLQVGQGKTTICYNLVEEYEGKGYCVIVCSPFIKLVNKDYVEIKGKVEKVRKSGMVTAKPIKVFKYDDVSVLNHWGEVMKEVAANTHTIHIMTINCLLGNSGSNEFEQAFNKSDYLQQLLDANRKVGKRIVLVVDEIHESIENFNPSLIPNLMKWKGLVGSSGDGGAATQAQIGIGDFCLDAAGNIYITEPNNFRVRKVEISTGIISTIAGTGVQATDTNFGDGGLASIATFGSPNAVCTDNQNNIYISDYNFGVVRKITAATGIISTIAGNGTLASDPLGDDGAATAAALANPTSLFTDSTGNLFIQDKYSIRKVTKATGIITTIAGNKKPGFSGDGGDPLIAEINNNGFALNKAGTILYISDNGNNRIRKVSFISTSLCPPSGNKALTSNISGSSYQWQINNGTGFSNISDNANYIGASTGTVQLNNIPSSWTGYEFRCLVDGNYSEAFTLKFLDQWTGTVNNAWENAGNWSCSGVPDANTDVVINAGSTIVINSNVTVRSLQVSPGANLIVSPGNNLTVLH